MGYLEIYLIILGGDGLSMYFVDKEVWDWINAPFDRTQDEHGYSDTPPPHLITALTLQAQEQEDPDPELECYVTCGSTENDRMLFACGTIPGFAFTYDSIKDLFEDVQKNAVVIVDETDGLFY